MRRFPVHLPEACRRPGRKMPISETKSAGDRVVEGFLTFASTVFGPTQESQSGQNREFVRAAGTPLQRQADIRTRGSIRSVLLQAQGTEHHVPWQTHDRFCGRRQNACSETFRPRQTIPVRDTTERHLESSLRVNRSVQKSRITPDGSRRGEPSLQVTLDRY